MNPKNSFPSIVLLSIVILVCALLFAPRYQVTAAPPAPQVEIAGPLPLPVAPVEAKKDIVRGQVQLIHEEDRVQWTKANGDQLDWNIPVNQMLVITDILISKRDNSLNDFDKFQVAFFHQTDEGEMREFDISGIILPYSHSFTTPLYIPFPEGGYLNVHRETNINLSIIITGYFEPILTRG